MNLNKVFLIGRLVQDVEIRYLPSGTPVAVLNVATNRSFKDRQGNLREETEYHRVIAWGKLGETCKQYLSKGRLIFVEGRIRSRSWLDAQGNKRTSFEIIAEAIKFGPKPGTSETEKEVEEIEPDLDSYTIPEDIDITDLPY
jgi:single-strand DNA-binding protein